MFVSDARPFSHTGNAQNVFFWKKWWPSTWVTRAVDTRATTQHSSLIPMFAHPFVAQGALYQLWKYIRGSKLLGGVGLDQTRVPVAVSDGFSTVLTRAATWGHIFYPNFNVSFWSPRCALSSVEEWPRVPVARRSWPGPSFGDQEVFPGCSKVLTRPST